jgi:hypothetical protein
MTVSEPSKENRILWRARVRPTNTLERCLIAESESVFSAGTIRYDRGGGHFLFVRKDYWWDDLKTFLDERLKKF